MDEENVNVTELLTTMNDVLHHYLKRSRSHFSCVGRSYWVLQNDGQKCVHIILQQEHTGFCKGEKAGLLTSEVQKYGEVRRSTKKYGEVQRSTEKYREVQGSTEKYREVRRSTRKYREVQRSTRKYREVHRSTRKYREVQRSTILFSHFFLRNRAKMFCYWEMSKILFPLTEHFFSVIGNKLLT
jgi:hypothetical protein